jgi:O-antigen ligase
MFYAKNDPNSIWRYYVWMNEIDSLIKTYFTGVGFGSAYISNDIIYQVDNINMYYKNVEGSFETGAFIIANHSSLINMFYRMGLIGGLLFISLYVQIIRIVCKLYNQTDIIKRKLLWYLFSVWIYETVVIFLNPGLEMMQFALSYLLSLAMLFAVIIDIQISHHKKHLRYLI